MKNLKLRTIMFLLFALSVASTSVGCSYGGIATTKDNYVVVSRNNMFLFGLLRTVFVCQVGDQGLQNCKEGEIP